MPAGTLFVVATPIGNLEDITLRALRTLREVDLIAAEDTRRTARLLARHGISTPSLSFHAHNVRSRLPRLMERLQSGHSVALVTDAGTPGISDPGAELVRICWESSLPVDAIPGPSAPIAAAACSGFPLEPTTIVGFAPSRGKDRLSFFQMLAQRQEAVVLFESPHHIEDCLKLLDINMPRRVMLLAREMTKAHQEMLRGTAAEVRAKLSSKKGEFTIVLAPEQEEGSAPKSTNEAQIINEFFQMTEQGSLSRRDIVKAIARKHQMAVKIVYEAVERCKQSVT